jgi:hypothetical protein
MLSIGSTDRPMRFTTVMSASRSPAGSLTVRRALGDLRGQADSLRELGETVRALGRSEEGRAYWLEALAIFEQLGTSDVDRIRDLLAGLSASRRRADRSPTRWPRGG